VLILLPPSEGKAATDAGEPFSIDALSLPELNPTRTKVRDALVKLCSGREKRAREVLGLSAKQADELVPNRDLAGPLALPAAQVYTGVLYAALGYPTLTTGARRRANERVLVSSALWGAVHLDDAIPAYRLSGDVTLRRLGTITKTWRTPMARAMKDAATSGVVFDLRSGVYAKMWTPDAEMADLAAVGRVLLQRSDGSRTVVSHHNKATKGYLVRALLSQSKTPHSVEELTALIEKVGFDVELSAGREGRPWKLDVVVDQV